MENARADKRIAFIDRDGVINVNPPPHEYVTRPEGFVFNEGIFELLDALQSDGFELIVVTNQRGVARGLLSEEALFAIHERMRKGLAERGIRLLDIFYCPHENDSCDCRKPKDGLLRQAAAKYPIDLASSLLISDSEADVLMAQRFGIGRAFLVPQNHPESGLTGYLS